MNMLFEVFEKGELSESQRLVVVLLLDKIDKCLLYIKSWRSLKILCVDYHILSKIQGLRFKSVISNIIHQDHTDFMTNIYISFNIVTLQNLIDYVNKNHITSLLICIDFENAYDSIEWGFLFEV